MDFVSKYFNYKSQSNISGLTEELAVLYFNEYFNRFKKNIKITIFTSLKSKYEMYGS